MKHILPAQMWEFPNYNRDIVAENTILCCQVGSGVHGVTHGGNDDFDLMGIAIEPPEVMLGQDVFEHWVPRWHADGTPIRDGERSGAGDTDLTVYGLRKWATLAAQKGNPTVLIPLFAPEHEFVQLTQVGRALIGNRHLFLSKRSGKAFSGYLQGQVELMLGQRAGKRKHTNRPELIEQYGFDTKAAYHALRVGIQGVELMLEKEITLPVPTQQREFLLDVRAGVYSVDFIVQTLDALDSNLQKAIKVSTLPDSPDFDAINEFLIKLYRVWWGWV